MIKELLETERSYIGTLEFALENHCAKLSAPNLPSNLKGRLLTREVESVTSPTVLWLKAVGGIFISGKKLVLFANMEEIYRFHKDEFLPELEACGDDAEKV